MPHNCTIIDESGRDVAEILIRDNEEGWYYGTVLQDKFNDYQRRSIQWYDQVVTEQMLSYFDEALAAVNDLGLQVRLSDKRLERLYSMHIAKSGEISFRTSPIPPPDRSNQENNV